MKLYSEQDCLQNPLYADLMDDLNVLYLSIGKPAYIGSEGVLEVVRNEFWQPETVGFWNGHESVISRSANEQLWSVYKGLNFTNEIEVSFTNQSSEWKSFVKQSLELIEDYNLNRIHNKLACTC